MEAVITGPDGFNSIRGPSKVVRERGNKGSVLPILIQTQIEVFISGKWWNCCQSDRRESESERLGKKKKREEVSLSRQACLDSFL